MVPITLLEGVLKMGAGKRKLLLGLGIASIIFLKVGAVDFSWTKHKTNSVDVNIFEWLITHPI